MSQTKPIPPRGADAATVADVRRIIADSTRHLYSVSLIYRVYNAVFGLNERPQTCGSCLQRRARALKGWLAEYEAAQAAAPAPPKRKRRKKVATPEPVAEAEAAEPDSAPAADPVEAEAAAPADPEPADATTAEPSEGAER